ncbi:inactive transglutaminase family protein [Thiorhodospira sibirica]|uniref:inactive transglutaminase family protein n=1 Tax=Thiorhodospira sibirica TaxID=154347 RepID=UPI00022C285A|nr:inactive transglutaminase family protein [Thiorhodospira sibirica]
MSRPLFYSLIAFLIVTAIGTAWLRHIYTQIPFLPGEQTTAWIVEARIDFSAQGEPVLLSLNIPEDPPGFQIVSEQTASPGYGFSIVEYDGDRRGEWSIRTASGRQTLYYKIKIIPERSGLSGPHEPQAKPRIEPVFWEESAVVAAEQLLGRARALSSTPQSMTRELIKLLSQPEPGQNAALLLTHHPREVLLEKLLNQAGVPTRLAMGLWLEDARRNQTLTPMLEIYVEGRWIMFDPRTGRQGVPENLLLWQRGGPSLIDLMGGARSQVSFSMIRQTIPTLELAHTQYRESGFDILGIHRLPIEEQGVFKLLLLLPMGALVTVFMRIIIGLRTSGTFMPVLIALAFLQTSLLQGLINFVVIVAIGLLLRSYLSHLNLLLVARIATIIVIVIFIVALISLLGYQLGLNTGMTVAFFPIIIIAWTIERMSILWEEEGPWEVLVQGGGSLLVAVAAYLSMTHPLVGHLSFNFPELNLVLVALIMLMGQYTGYRLSELYRFRDIEQHVRR